MEPTFKNKQGIAFPTFGSEQFRYVLKELNQTYGLTSPQLVEAASYSMAMVVRFALGLSSEGGRVCALVGDCLAGWTALATLRHLTNAGASGFVAILDQGKAPSAELEQQLMPLRKVDMEIFNIPSKVELDDQFSAKIGACHNTICGLFDFDFKVDQRRPDLMEALNELSTPIHCLVCPPGVDPDSGDSSPSVIYASSTLSLGVPLSGLVKGADQAGRQYLCDLSIPARLYSELGFDLSLLFSEQPVLQIFAAGTESGNE